MPKGQGNNFPWKRTKILVEPIGTDYTTRLQARLAWNSNAMFEQVTSGTDGKHINRTHAEKVENKIAEVMIKFDKGRQGVLVRIGSPTAEQVESLRRATAS